MARAPTPQLPPRTLADRCLRQFATTSSSRRASEPKACAIPPSASLFSSSAVQGSPPGGGARRRSRSSLGRCTARWLRRWRRQRRRSAPSPTAPPCEPPVDASSGSLSSPPVPSSTGRLPKREARGPGPTGGLRSARIGSAGREGWWWDLTSGSQRKRNSPARRATLARLRPLGRASGLRPSEVRRLLRPRPPPQSPASAARRPRPRPTCG
jgi:hypothetical protein